MVAVYVPLFKSHSWARFNYQRQASRYRRFFLNHCPLHRRLNADLWQSAESAHATAIFQVDSLEMRGLCFPCTRPHFDYFSVLVVIIRVVADHGDEQADVLIVGERAN